MVRENAAAKAVRYLAEGRVSVLHVNGSTVRASVRGSGAFYETAHDRGQWSCSCPSLRACAHVLALQLVTAPVVTRRTR